MSEENWRQKQEEETKALADAISRYVNHTHDYTDVIARIAQDHRTLQQKFTGVCLAWFKHLSELPSGHYDLRNEHSVKVAKMIRTLLEEQWGSAWSHMPLI